MGQSRSSPVRPFDQPVHDMNFSHVLIVSLARLPDQIATSGNIIPANAHSACRPALFRVAGNRRGQIADNSRHCEKESLLIARPEVLTYSLVGSP
jgi:hypothetical protein